MLGELLITGGVFVLLFLGWQLWFNDLVVGGAAARRSRSSRSQAWERDAPPPDARDPGRPAGRSAAPATSETFGLMIVPRFGADYYRPIAEGTGTSRCSTRAEIGHYPSSQMPGRGRQLRRRRPPHQLRRPFNQISSCSVGDHIYVETADGWYAYVFRNLEYVRPTGVGVSRRCRRPTGATASDRLMTMTSCNPLYSSAERIIAYSVFDRFYPRADGPPDEIAATVAGAA